MVDKTCRKSHDSQHCASLRMSIKSKSGRNDSGTSSAVANEIDGDDTAIKAVAMTATTTFESISFMFQILSSSVHGIAAVDFKG
mmetsp:Transcript_9383/g.23391  ORF Transcript_9383/g.23391 Transcript_9383/m.23391 type:complete len:84 (-) Transcript_9383:133-384(-)